MMNILENKKKHIIYEDNDRVAKKLERYLNSTILKMYKDEVCKFEVSQGSTIMPFDVIVYFLLGSGNSRREDIINKAWDFVYNATGKSSGVYSEIVDDCQEPMNLQESIRKILKEETSLQSRVKEMIESKGVVVASKVVGGIDNLVKILKLDLDDLETQEELAKNFLEFLKPTELEVVGVEKRISSSGNIILNILYRNTHQQINFRSNLIYFFLEKLNNFFPFKIKGAHEPNFSPYVKKISIDVTPYDDEDEDEMNLQETELTERCWKGYTQKGMKTMFGKRYPNCVKIKKK